MSKFNEDRRNNSGTGRYGLSRAQVTYAQPFKSLGMNGVGHDSWRLYRHKNKVSRQ